MGNSLDKRTNLEYGFRPSVDPGQSYQDFITQIPDQAIANQTVQKHSEFKKPYLNSTSYQAMDYHWDGIKPVFRDTPVRGEEIPQYSVPTVGPPNYTPPSPGEDIPQFPIPDYQPSPDYPVPTIPNPTPPPVPPSPKPGQPAPVLETVYLFQKCCGKGLRLSSPATVDKDDDLPVTYSGGNPECWYEIEASGDGYWKVEGMPGAQNSFNERFEGGTSGTSIRTGFSKCGPITISVTPEDSWGNQEARGKICVKNTIQVTGCCTCGSAYIDFTTQTMGVGTEQTLTIGTPDPGSTYLWSLTGGGSISSTSGDSITYTAAADNANCVNNATVTLTCVGGDVCATLGIAVNADIDTFEAVRIWTTSCDTTWDGLTFHTVCVATVNRYYCNGLHYDGPCDASAVWIWRPDMGGTPHYCAEVCDWPITYPACGSGNLSPNQLAASPHDRRSLDQIMAGCCPSQLL